jgi:hypothetical protein
VALNLQKMKKIIILFQLVFPFIMGAQSIESISPVTASLSESFVLTVVGKNTTFKSGENSVILTRGSTTINATSVICVNDTLLNATFTLINANQDGYDVIVFNSKTNSSIKFATKFSIVYNPYPNNITDTLISITQPVALQGDQIEVTATFSNTHFTKANPTSVSLRLESPNSNAKMYPAATKVIDDVTIKSTFKFTYDDLPGRYDLICLSSSNGTITSKLAFTLNPGNFPPKLTNITPNSGRKGDSVLVTLTAENFSFIKDSMQIILKEIDDVYPHELYGKINYINNSKVSALFYITNGIKTGPCDIVIRDILNHELKFKNSFNLLANPRPPILASFSPTTVKQGDSILIRVTGKNTQFLNGKNNNSFTLNGKIELLALTIETINDSVIEGKFAFDYLKCQPGKFAVIIRDNVDGHLIAADSLIVTPGDKPLRLISIKPDHVTQGQSLRMVVKNSKNLFSLLNQPQIELTHGNTILKYYDYKKVSDTIISMTVEFPTDSQTTGIYDLILTDSWYNFKYVLSSAVTVDPAPTSPLLLSITPANANQSTNVTVRVNGSHTHFLPRNNNSNIIYLQSSDASNFRIIPQSTNVLDDSTLDARFSLNASYYPSTEFDIVIENSLDQRLEIKKAFTINNNKKIIDIYPKEALQGESITMDIKGNGQAFTSGNNVVKLFNSDNSKNPISSTAVSFINDSILSASFSFNPGSNSIGFYYVNVNNKPDQYNLTYNGFQLKSNLIKLKLVTPAWASQKDTVTLLITGINTHFDYSDNIWLENKYGMKVKPFAMHLINDTATSVKIAFDKNTLPISYTVYLTSKIDKITIALINAFTVIGRINANEMLHGISPFYFYGCNSNKTIQIITKNTHFLSDVDTVLILNKVTSEVVYPKEMKILNDTTISANFDFVSCGLHDILIQGKTNYLFGSALTGFYLFVSVDEPSEKTPIKIFPNPSEGIFTLNVNEDFEKGSLYVFDMYGKMVIALDNLTSSTQLDLSNYASGLYFVKLIKGTSCKTEKIIKQ